MADFTLVGSPEDENNDWAVSLKNVLNKGSNMKFGLLEPIAFPFKIVCKSYETMLDYALKHSKQSIESYDLNNEKIIEVITDQDRKLDDAVRDCLLDEFKQNGVRKAEGIKELQRFMKKGMNAIVQVGIFLMVLVAGVIVSIAKINQDK
ncbi:hypothetical protein [Exiguobacterium sp. SH3S1]|uniref:hypothetical protein n=1 Tax=Exiguobacterium sp. SH3S1 TaxID=2510955 RepID=UPI00103BE672|nr:hypothetical protein [Exiguobacterium sp. SH3S1]TCI61811.1 hypothetical protein EVJ26_09625 [Exiguobacterium sp. SH3S1]